MRVRQRGGERLVDEHRLTGQQGGAGLSQVRLAEQMHRGIDAYVAIAEQHEHDDDLSRKLRDGLTAYYAEQLADHGFTGGDELMRQVLSIDIELNAQGLEVWLQRRNK